MNRPLLFAFLLLSSTVCFSQTKGDILIGVQLDLIKTNNSGYFQRLQAGTEGNWFFHKRFTATGGFEYWSENRQPSLVTGVRWYPIEEAFLRVRGLLGANDFAVGGGWSMPVNEKIRFEALSDFYFAGHITIRAGFTYTLLNTSQKK
ncbi:MAG TPA: hypothetical protein VGD65_18350 [Chryseosolibacter sp.]